MLRKNKFFKHFCKKQESCVTEFTPPPTKQTTITVTVEKSDEVVAQYKVGCLSMCFNATKYMR